jgi:peroxiredoxin
MRAALWAALALAFCSAAFGTVVRPAPNFGIEGVSKSTTLRSFRGQSVVLIITRRARDKQFRDQVRRLRDLYAQFATEKVVFIAAVEEGPEDVPSDIPFMTASDPAQVAADYGVTGRFGIAVIGVDGNVDLVTGKVIPAARVKDAIFNNYEIQAGARKGTGF